MNIRSAIYNGLGYAAHRLEQRAVRRRMAGGHVTGRKIRRSRGYAAAVIDRLTSDWIFSQTSADTEIYQALKVLRGRSRELFRNDDYIKRFSRLLKTNVLGSEGIRLQSRAEDKPGELDSGACKTIERAWQVWSRKKNCSVCGTLSLWRIANMVLDAWASDGEVLLQKVVGWKGNKFRFAIKVIEADHLDIDRNEELANGNRIVMGVEKDANDRPVAYWILTRHPGNQYSQLSNRSERIPAKYIEHIFEPERPGQTRGVPLIITAMRRLRQLGGYEEAELIAARVGASKMGFFKPSGGADFGDTDYDDDGNPIEIDDPAVDLITEARPGTFEQLPENMDFLPWDPDHPSTAFEPFGKAILRGAASGLNVSYVALSNNLEGVSYSSIRSGEMNDRDAWRMVQRWMIENFYEPVFEAWLPMALTSGMIELPVGKLEKWLNVRWKPRGWKWVDPVKESAAHENDVSNCFSSLFDVAAERGYDLEEVIEENARARKLARDAGLSLPVFEGKVNNLEELDNEPEQSPAATN